MLNLKLLALCIALFIAFASACGSAGAETLQGGIGVVDKRYEAGQVYQEPEQKIVDFYVIPSWFAGVFQRDQLERQTIFGKITSKNKHVVRHGHQTDLRGNIWHARVEPWLHTTERPKDLDHYITTQIPELVTPQRVIMHYRGLLVIERKKDGKIKQTYQIDETHIFEAQSINSVAVHTGDTFMYNEDGKFLFKQPPCTYTDYRIEPYSDLDADDTFDYKAAFIRFLSRQ